MDKIELLLAKLGGRIPASLGKKIDALDVLDEKMDAIGKEYEENPTPENKEKYSEIVEFFEEKELEVVEALENLVEQRQREAKARANKPAQPTEPVKSPVPAQTNTEEKPVEREKKGGFGILGLIAGGILFVASLGAIRFLNKK